MTVGSSFDVYDQTGFHKAIVLEQEGSTNDSRRVLVHYHGWNHKWDEWVTDFSRIRPLGTTGDVKKAAAIEPKATPAANRTKPVAERVAEPMELAEEQTPLVNCTTSSGRMSQKVQRYQPILSGSGMGNERGDVQRSSNAPASDPETFVWLTPADGLDTGDHVVTAKGDRGTVVSRANGYYQLQLADKTIVHSRIQKLRDYDPNSEAVKPKPKPKPALAPARAPKLAPAPKLPAPVKPSKEAGRKAFSEAAVSKLREYYARFDGFAQKVSEEQITEIMADPAFRNETRKRCMTW